LLLNKIGWVIAVEITAPLKWRVALPHAKFARKVQLSARPTEVFLSYASEACGGSTTAT